MPAGGLLGIKQVAIDGHFKHAPFSGNDLQRCDGLLVRGKQIVRQTDGSILVASDGAVFDRDVHRILIRWGGFREGYLFGRVPGA